MHAFSLSSCFITATLERGLGLQGCEVGSGPRKRIQSPPDPPELVQGAKLCTITCIQPPRGLLVLSIPLLLASAKLLTFTFQGLSTSKSPFHLPILLLLLSPSAQPGPPPSPFTPSLHPLCVPLTCLLANSFHAVCACISLLKPHLACIRSFFLPPCSPSQN